MFRQLLVSKNMKGVTLGAFLAILLYIGVDAAHAKEPKVIKDPTLKIGVDVESVATLDPHTTTKSLEVYVAFQVYEALMQFKPGTVEPGDPALAKRWEVSKDKLIWTFHLREGVKWHKGYGEFTAEDVEFSIERVKDPSTGSIFVSEMVPIKDVKVVDKYTVEIHLKSPYPFLPFLVSNYHGGFILSKRAWKELGAAGLKVTPIGTGPFEYEKLVPGEKIVLKRFDEYWGGRAKLAKIEYWFMSDISARVIGMSSGSIDIAQGKLDTKYVKAFLEKARGAKNYPAMPAGWTVHFNMKYKPFDDIRVRKALAYAIDRESHVKHIGEEIAEPMVSPVPNGYVGSTTDVEKYEYNPQEARKLLKEAGYPNGFSFKTKVTTYGAHLDPLLIVQEEWRKIGVKMEIDTIAHTAWHALYKKDGAPVVPYSAARQPYADIYLTQFYYGPSAIGKPTAVRNISHYGDLIPGVDDLIEAARLEVDPAKRNELWAKAQRKIMEDVPAYPVVQRRFPLIAQPWVKLGYEWKTWISNCPPITVDTYITERVRP